jgi:hypothetical protein
MPLPYLWPDRSLRFKRCHPLFCKNATRVEKNFVDKIKLATVAIAGLSRGRKPGDGMIL